MEINLYHYHAHVTDVYDGDTLTVDIDLGLHTWLRGEKLRLYRINAPELRGADKARGEKSRDFLRDLVLNRDVVLKTIADRREKYGRYLAEIWLLDEQGAWVNVNDKMVKESHAEYKKYDNVELAAIAPT
jgi:micrococcal nuclease